MVMSTYGACMDALTAATEAADTTRPEDGLRAVAVLRRLTDTLELAQVEAALRSGMGWGEIASCLGVSRQAVHKKHAKRVQPGLAPTRRR